NAWLKPAVAQVVVPRGAGGPDHAQEGHNSAGFLRRRLHARMEVPTEGVVAMGEAYDSPVIGNGRHIQRKLAAGCQALLHVEPSAGHTEGQRPLQESLAAEGIVNVLLFDLRIQREDVDGEHLVDDG